MAHLLELDVQKDVRSSGQLPADNVEQILDARSLGLQLWSIVFILSKVTR